MFKLQPVQFYTMQKTVLITGATSGIGEACAKKYAANHTNLILVARRANKLNALAKELQSQFNVKVLPVILDVRDRKAVTTALESIPADWRKIDVLVNNAGLAAGLDDFEDASLDDWDTMVDTNLKGFAYVAQTISKYMIESGAGHIVNIGSTAGKDVYARGNMYCATKHAVVALSEGMRIDLLPHNIKVTTVNPGAVITGFSMVRLKGDKAAAEKVYEGIKPLTGDDVAEVIFYCTSLPAHVCINDLVLTCTQQANSFYYNRTQ